MECDITGIQCLNRESVLSSSYIYSLYRENPLSQTSWSFENQQLISSFLSASMSSSSSNSKQITGSPSSPFKRLRMASSSVARQEDGYVPFADLSTGLDRAIMVMVCRWWDACSTAGKYLSTEFIMPECAGNAIHCVARSSISNCFATKFEVGEVYSMKHFTVQPNKDTYRLRNSVNTSLNWKVIPSLKSFNALSMALCVICYSCKS